MTHSWINQSDIWNKPIQFLYGKITEFHFFYLSEIDYHEKINIHRHFDKKSTNNNVLCKPKNYYVINKK